MSNSTEKVKRPTSITFICGIGFLGALFAVPLVFSPMAQQIGSWYPPYLGFSFVIGLICLIGLWMMKKWAAYTYAVFALLNQIVLLAMGIWNVMALLIPAVVIFVAFKHVSQMS